MQFYTSNKFKNQFIHNVNGDESKTAKSLKGDISTHHHIA